MTKRLTIDSFKVKILTFISITFIVFIISIAYIMQTLQEKSLKYTNKQNDELIHNAVNHTLEHSKNQYINILNRIVAVENIEKHLQNKQRETLYNELYPIFVNLQNENPYVQTLHIISADGRSFLRVHQKDHYGDSLGEIRPMIKDMMKNHTMIYGYETGVYAEVFRVIKPLFYKDKFIGSIGIGVNPVYFIKKTTEIIDEKGALFLLSKNLKLYSLKQDFHIGDYYLQSDVEPSYIDILKQLPEDYKFQDGFVFSHGEKKYIIHTKEIENFSSEIVGKLLLIEDNTKEFERQKEAKILIITLVLFFVVIFFFTVRYYILSFGKELDKSYKFYEYAINGVQDGLWDWNLKTDEVYFSLRWKKMLGYKSDELKNELATWKKRVHPDDLERALEDIQKNIDKKTEYYENIHRLKHKDGSWVWILDRGKTFYDKNGTPERMVGFHTNITKIKQLENEIKQKDEMMITQSRNAAMGEMISMIAHQWRQPLSVISMGANNILADIELDMIDEKGLKEIALEVIDQTNELSQTIDDFKEFFKPIKKAEYASLDTIVEQALKIVGKSLENNNITLTKFYESAKEIEVYSRELLQVFINILNNAKEVLVEKNIQNKQIQISIHEEDDRMKIVFSDNGGGVDEEIKNKIFEPYFSTKSEKIGTGLGLYMSKMIIEKHHNGILEEKNKNGGASFCISIPFMRENKEQ